MKNLNIFLVGFAFFILSGCGDTEARKFELQSAVKLELFGAPWCKPCIKELNELKTKIPEVLGDSISKATVVVYVTTNEAPNVAPTQETAQAFCDKLGLQFQCIADIDSSGASTPTWLRYREVFPELRTKERLPAALLTGPTGEVLARFDPGTFTVNDILEHLSGYLIGG